MNQVKLTYESINITCLCFYTSLEVQQRTCLFFTKRFNHTAVVFSGETTIIYTVKHINRHFIGTQTVKTEKISKTRDLQVACDQKSVLCCFLFCACEGAGCWDKWVHRAHEAGCLPPG